MYVQAMDEGSRNLVQTCDAFVQVMDEIMELSEATHVFAVASNRVGDSYDMQGVGSKRTARRSRDTIQFCCDIHTCGLQFYDLFNAAIRLITLR